MRSSQKGMVMNMIKINDSASAKQHIAGVIRDLREKHGYTQKDIGNLTQKAHTTIASWESGKSQPDIDTLMQLCIMYNVDDILAEFGYRKPLSGLTDKEQEIIKLYRALGDDYHDFVINVLGSLVTLKEETENKLDKKHTFLAVARGNGEPTEIDEADLSKLAPRDWDVK